MRFRLLFLLLCVVFCKADAQITFQKVYGSDSIEEGAFISKSDDGGYYVSGSSTEYDAQTWDGFVMKIDSSGDSLWTRIFGLPGQDDGVLAMTSTNDGGVVCLLEMDISWPIYPVMLKFDKYGNQMWTKKFGPTDIVSDMIQTADGGFAVSCLSTNFNVSIVKTDSIGGIQWISTDSINNVIITEKLRLLQTNDKGYVIASTLHSTSDDGILTIKFDSVGARQWSRLYSSPANDHCRGLIQTSDSGLLILGSAESAPYSKATLIRMNLFGDTLWTKCYTSSPNGNEYMPCGISQTSTGGYVFSAITIGSFSINKIILMATDASGHLIYSRRYGGLSDDWPRDVIVTDDGGAIISGASKSYGSQSGYSNIYLIKADSNGISGCNELNYFLYEEQTVFQVSSPSMINKPPFNTQSVTPYSCVLRSGFDFYPICYTGVDDNSVIGLLDCEFIPNPSNNSTIFIFSGETYPDDCNLEIFNVTGELIRNYSVTGKQTVISTFEFPEGTYIYRLSSGGSYIATGKLIICK
jgi:hypothetical protein